MEYINLYKLQDKVLDIIFKHTTLFYLTGGTALNRFYYDYRYSDDLDFFAIDNFFSFEVKKILEILKDNFNLKIEVSSINFWLIYIENLKIDFVDTHYEKHFGEFLRYKNYIIDSKENIFTNKITAILGRDEPKDIADFYFLKKNENFDINRYLDYAREKIYFDNEDFLIRLKTFPKDLLKNINFKANYLDEIYNDFDNFIEKIQKEIK